MKTELSQQHPPPPPAHKVCPGQSMAPAEPRTPSSPQLQPHSPLTAPRLAPQSCGRRQAAALGHSGAVSTTTSTLAGTALLFFVT